VWLDADRRASWSRTPTSKVLTALSSLLLYHQSKKATEQDLRREFEMYGAIERVRIVRDQKDKSRGYAFIVYERERDMKGVSGGSLCRLLVSR
jgi:RNA recognition motif-containing protein